MASMYGRQVQFEDGGKVEIGTCITSGYPNDWIKVLRTDGTYTILHTGEYRLYPLRDWMDGEYPISACRST